MKKSRIVKYPLTTIKNLEKFKIVETNEKYSILENGDTKIVKNNKYINPYYYLPPKGFKIERVLGSGLIGFVLLLTEINTKKRVAYKVGDIDFVVDDGFLQIISLKKMENHSNVPKLIGITPDGFLMEYLHNYYTIEEYLKLLQSNNIKQNQIILPQKIKNTKIDNNVSYGMRFSMHTISKEYVSKYEKIVETLVNYAEHLSREISEKYKIAHMDLHFGNVMISTTRDLKKIKSIKIIDWGSTNDNSYINEQKRLEQMKKTYKYITNYVYKNKNFE